MNSSQAAGGTTSRHTLLRLGLSSGKDSQTPTRNDKMKSWLFDSQFEGEEHQSVSRCSGGCFMFSMGHGVVSS